MTHDQDIAFMSEAVVLARRAVGRTAPNPSVGAVVVQDGRIVGRGFHPRAGLPHAEVYALDEAGDKARGATLYVTLEPCNHQGRTPPCTEAVIRAGIARVVAGALDPNPLVAGRGFERLKAAGVQVDVGVLADECRDLIAWYAHWMEKKRPFVIMKAAITLDGRIAAATGDSAWISSEESRAYVHELRNRWTASWWASARWPTTTPCSLPHGGREGPGADHPGPRARHASGCQVPGRGNHRVHERTGGCQARSHRPGVKVVAVEQSSPGVLSWPLMLEYLGSAGLHSVMVGAAAACTRACWRAASWTGCCSSSRPWSWAAAYRWWTVAHPRGSRTPCAS